MYQRLRRVASVSVALTILIGIPLAGGAWLSSGSVVPTSTTGASPLLATTSTATVARAAPATSYRFVQQQPEPDSGSSVTQWICEIDGTNERCPPVKHAEALTDAVPARSLEAPAGTATASTSPAAPEARAGTATASTSPAQLAAPAADPLDIEPADAPSFDRFIPLNPESAEDWRPLISLFFRAEDVDRAVRVVECESHGLPEAKNPRSTASGLFQHLASHWPERAAKAGYGGTDVFDPVANTAVAAWLVYEGGGWRHWNASRGCW